MPEEFKEPWHELVNYLRDNTIFARHSRHEVRNFLDRIHADGFHLKKAEPERTIPRV